MQQTGQEGLSIAVKHLPDSPQDMSSGSGQLRRLAKIRSHFQFRSTRIEPMGIEHGQVTRCAGGRQKHGRQQDAERYSKRATDAAMLLLRCVGHCVGPSASVFGFGSLATRE